MSTEKARKLGTVETPPPAEPSEPQVLPPVPSWAYAALVAGVVVVSGLSYGLLTWARVGALRWLWVAAAWFAFGALRKVLPGLRERFRLSALRKEGRQQCKFVRGRVKAGRFTGGDEARRKLESACAIVDEAVQREDAAAIELALAGVEEAAAKHVPMKNATRETIEQVAVAVLIALFVRAFFYEAFRIPSSSMVPTLLVGDHLFVNKFTYGLRIPFTVTKVLAQVPERGDIVVFNRPGDEHGDDVIKRVVGLPGDRVEVRDRRILVNGEPLAWKSLGEVELDDKGDLRREGGGETDVFERFEETVGETTHVALARRGSMQGEDVGNEGTWIVLPGHVFVMGDNRDNSQDSRFAPRADGSGGFGQVPIEHVKGRADLIWLSIGGPRGLRFERMFTKID